MPILSTRTAGPAFAGLALLLASLGTAAETPAPAPGTYRVAGGKVDAGTFRGWLTYHIACSSCHGADGAATGVAPDLPAALRTMSQADFARKVLTRYRISLSLTESLFSDAQREAVLDEVRRRQSQGEPAGTTMPAWQSDPVISSRVMDLYAYLRARSDGVLGVGRPDREE